MSCEIIKRIEKEIERDRELKILREFKSVMMQTTPQLSSRVLTNMVIKRQKGYLSS